MLKSRKMLIFSIFLIYYWRRAALKIYDYNGRKNLCGNRVREARQKQRLSRSDLAARLQIAGIILERDSVSRIESGTRFVADYELKVLAQVLKVDLAWLLEDPAEY